MDTPQWDIFLRLERLKCACTVHLHRMEGAPERWRMSIQRPGAQGLEMIACEADTAYEAMKQCLDEAERKAWLPSGG